MMKRIFLLPWVLLVLAAGGCNVFEGLGGGSPSDDPAILLTDGQRALERGQADEAVQLLTRAVRRTEARRYEGRIARLKLASALLLQKRLSILAVQDVATGFVAALDGAPATASPALPTPPCTTTPTRRALDTLGVTAVTGYADVHAARAVLDTVRVLLQGTLGTPFPASTEQIQVGLASLVAQGADESIRAEALANTTLVLAALGYDDLVMVGVRNQIRWIAVRDDLSGTVLPGACASSLAFLNTLSIEARAPLDLLGTSAEAARLRAALPLFANATGAQMLAQDLARFRDRLASGLLASF